MPTILISDVISLPDVLIGDLFDFNIPNPPAGNGQALYLRNMKGVLPVIPEAKPIILETHRHAVQFAGKVERSGNFAATYFDTSDRQIFNILEGWSQACTDMNTGIPKSAAGYKTLGTTSLHDANNNVAVSRTFYGLWISGVEAIQLGGESAPVDLTVTFQYDYFTFI